jgi:hypothetical protein
MLRDPTPYASFEWLPSQNGAFFVCLQPHHATVLAVAISVFKGAKPVPLWEPSQNGWPLDFPHAHQKSVPGSAFWTKGDLWAIVGSMVPQK